MNFTHFHTAIENETDKAAPSRSKRPRIWHMGIAFERLAAGKESSTGTGCVPTGELTLGGGGPLALANRGDNMIIPGRRDERSECRMIWGRGWRDYFL